MKEIITGFLTDLKLKLESALRKENSNCVSKNKSHVYKDAISINHVKLTLHL